MTEPPKAMKWLREKLRQIRRLEGGAHAISLGIGVGTFISFLPPLGLKTLLAMAITRLGRGNVIASAIAVTLHDLLIPLAPVILIFEYQLGVRLLGHSADSVSPLEVFQQGPAAMLHWATLFRFEVPLILGGALTGLPFGLLGYFLTRRFLRPKSGAEPGA